LGGGGGDTPERRAAVLVLEFAVKAGRGLGLSYAEERSGVPPILLDGQRSGLEYALGRVAADEAANGEGHRDGNTAEGQLAQA